MNQPKNPSRFSRRGPIVSLPVAGFAMSLAAVLAPSPLHALAITWNNSGTNFNATGSWTGGLPGSADAATFGTTVTNQPNLTAGISVGQLILNGSGWNLTSINTSTALTLVSTSTSTGTTGANGAAIIASGGTVNTVSAPLVLGGAAASTFTFRGNTTATRTTVNGVISELNTGINLSLVDAGTWTFTNANTYTGTTSLSSGAVLTAANSGALGTSTAGINVISGTALQLQNNITISGKPLALNGTGVSNGGGLRNLSGDNTFGGLITLGAASTRINSDSGTLTLDVASGNAIEDSSADTLTFGGAGHIVVADPMSLAGGALTKDGAGTLTLLAANTYGGNITVNGGMLRLDHSGALGSGNLNIAGGVVGLGAADFSRPLGGSAGQARFTASGGFAAYGANRSAAITGTLVWGGTSFLATGEVLILGADDATHTIDFTSSINLGTGAGITTREVRVPNGSAQVDAVLSGNLTSTGGTRSLNKTGAGTLLLKGTNSYSGGTTVTEGALLLSSAGTLPNTTLTVSPNATIGGNGTINGVATVGGILAPGESIGTLTVNNDVTWNAGNAWQFELGAPVATLLLASTSNTGDLLRIAGVGSDFLKGTGSGWTFDFQGTGPTGGLNGWYRLVDWDGTTTFNAGDFGAPQNLKSGYTGTYVVDAATTALYLQVVPEPSAALLAALGGLALLRRRRA